MTDGAGQSQGKEGASHPPIHLLVHQDDSDRRGRLVIRKGRNILPLHLLAHQGDDSGTLPLHSTWTNDCVCTYMHMHV